jgi:SNF2 family DNA or RNA helicase
LDCADELEISDVDKYGSKLAEIVKTLKHIKSLGEKAIMFVQWTDLMRSVRAILSNGGVKAVAITGNTNTRNAAMRRMQTGDADVLLMSLETSTSGLNLIEANHVLFAHALVGGSPTTQAARVSQAVARVHRMGQTKPVTVHWFITRDTDEEALYNSNHRQSIGNP